MIEWQAARDLQDIGSFVYPSYRTILIASFPVFQLPKQIGRLSNRVLGELNTLLTNTFKLDLAVPRLPLLPADESTKAMLDVPMKRALEYENSL